MPVLYCKIAAVNFDATVFDSQDLATIRGGSAAALRLIPALAHTLEASTPSGLDVDRLYASASEAVIRWTADSAPARPPAIPKPRGKNENAWTKAIRGVLAAADPEAAARELWEREGGKGLERTRGQPYTIELLLGRVRAARAAHAGGAGIGELLAEFETGLGRTVDAFLAKATEPAWSRLCVLQATWRSARDELPKALVALDNRLRERQLQGWTLPPPPRGAARPMRAQDAVCAVTGVLPADPDQSPAHERRSRSVIDRRRSGIDQRQWFYEDQLERAAAHAEALAAEADELDPAVRADLAAAPRRLRDRKVRLQADAVAFAQSFADIVDAPPEGLPVSVQGKLALVHLDGNAFGGRREAQATQSFEAYRRFSRWLEVLGGLLLADLLDWMVRRPDMWTERNLADPSQEAVRRLRFETLLWGGDEMTFVLPAWAGWDFVGALARSLARWREPGPGGGPLTFAIGMVLGQVKTPIRELKAAAEALQFAAKGDRAATRVQVMTVEGVDHADLDVAGLRAAWLGPAVAADEAAWSIGAASWEDATRAARELLRRVGRSQLHRQLRAAEAAGHLGKGGEEARGAAKAMRERLGQLGVDSATAGLLLDDRLAAGSRWPFLPLHELLELADFIEAGSAP